MITGQLIGGIGNQLFIMATILAYSLKHNMDYCLPRKVHQPHYPTDKDHSYNFPNAKYCDTELNLPIYTEPHYHYSEIPYMPDVCLNGYFQSYKYFNNYKDEIIKLFGFDDIETKELVCSIHVRRGDYLDYSNHHPPINEKYLIQAMRELYRRNYEPTFKFYSDDIEWCKQFTNSPFIKNYEKFEYSEGKSELDDLRGMASCEHNITANSSFSWWSAYINPNPKKKIVMPSAWFGSELSNNNVKDLYLPEAIII